MQESFPSQEFNRYMARSAQEYEAFKKKVVAREATANRPGMALVPSSSECRSIEIMCAGLSVAILEIFAGRRPANHIAKWLTKDCYEKIVNRARFTKTTLRRRYASVPLNNSPFRKNMRLPKARRARAQRVARNAFEVCLIMEDFSRVRAMAIRVEKIFTAWKITAIEIA